MREVWIRTIGALVAAQFVVGAGLVAGCDDTAPPAVGVTLRGWVVLGDRLAPGGARVELDGRRVIVVGADGRFAFADVDPGRHEVRASLAGYRSAEVTVDTATHSSGVVLVLEAIATNRSPAITTLRADPAVADPGGLVVLSADAQDPDGDALTYAWNPPVGWTLEGGGAQATLRSPPLYGASGIASVIVSDPSGGTAVASVHVRTRDNLPPSLISVSATPTQAAPGGRVTLVASGADPEGQPLTFTWAAPGDWALAVDPVDSSVATLTAPNAFGATATVSVSVSDGIASSAPARLTVSTLTNQGPVVNGLSLSENPVTKGGTIRLAVSASDPNGDPLAYAWQVSGAGWGLVPAGAQASLSAPNLPGSTATVTVTVSDGLRSASAAAVVATRPNGLPAIGSLLASPNPVARGGTVSLSALATDPDQDPLDYKWEIPTGAGWSLVSSGASATLTAPAVSSAAIVVTLAVTDPFGGQSVRQIAVSTRPNALPEVTSLVGLPNPVARTGEVALFASAFDPDGDPLTFSWSVPAGSGWTIAASGSAATLTAPALSSVSTTVSLVVSDGTAQVSEQLVVSTRANAAPEIASLVAAPNPVARGGQVTVSAAAFDPDGDALTYEWAVSPAGWTRSGTGASVTFQAPDTSAATAVVTVTVRDSGGKEATRQIALSTLPNRPPAIGSLVAAPNPVPRGGVITLSAIASDPDGDSVTYSWALTGAGWSLNGSGATVTLQAPAAASSTATVTLTVSDGTLSEAQQLVVSTAPNASPSIASVIATPSPVARGGTVTLVASANDPDGDDLTYTWSLPGGSDWTLSGSGASVTATAPDLPSASETVTLVVVDAAGGSATHQAVVATVPNSPPALFFPAFVDAPVHGRLFEYAPVARDDDGDLLTYALVDAPAGVTIDPATGAMSWFPGRADVGPFAFFVAVSDGFDTTTELFSGTVGPFRMRHQASFSGLPQVYPDNGQRIRWPEEGVIADFNGDGRGDFAMIDRHGNLGVALTDAAGFAAPALFFVDRTSEMQCEALGAADVDGVNGIDVVVACGDPNNDGDEAKLRVWLNDGAGSFSRSAPSPFGALPAKFYRRLRFGDFNADGKPDVFVMSSQQILVYQNQGGGTFSGASNLELPESCMADSPPANCGTLFSTGCSQFFRDLLAGNFDSDTGLELIVMQSRNESYSCSNGFFSFELVRIVTVDVTSAGTPEIAGAQTATQGFAQGLTAADLDKDGDLDLIFLTEGALWVGENAGGSFSFAPKAAVVTDAEGSVAVGDLDLDGNLDAVYSGEGSSGFQIHFGDGQLGFSSAVEHGRLNTLGECEVETAAVSQWDLDAAGAPDVFRIGECESANGESELSPVLFISY